MADERAGTRVISLKYIIMISFDKNIFERIHTVFVHRHEPEYARAFANLYWRVILVLAGLVIGGSVAYGAVVFFDVLSGKPSSTSVTAASVSTQSSFDRTKLDATLSSFTGRQAKFNSLQTGTIPQIPDPSK